MAEDGVEDSHEKAMTYPDATAGQSEDAPGATRERRAAHVISTAPTRSRRWRRGSRFRLLHGSGVGPSFTRGYVAARHAAHAGNIAG